MGIVREMWVEDWLGKDNKVGCDIWRKKYQRNGETFIEWLDRVSGGDEIIRQDILDKKFLFGGRILSNRGVQDRKVTYSNCYVIEPPEDNIESIFDAAKKLARTYSYGGGCGIDVSKLAPRGASINNAAKETTGAVSFMDLYNLTTSLIGQNGRRGALMLSINCNHPDLEEFIDVKTDLTKLTKANISVRVTDEFMKAVVVGEYHDLEFVRDETGEVITGDHILYIYGCYMKDRDKLVDNMVVTTVMSNFGLYKAFDAAGINYVKTAVGDKYVYECMSQNGYRIGGEQSGHIIFSKHATTGDGILTSLMVMEVMIEKKTSLNVLASEVTIYPQLLKNVRVSNKAAARNNAAVKEAIAEVEKELGDEGRILVRESGTEPVIRVMVEAKKDSICREMVDKVIAVMDKEGLILS